MRVFDEFEFLEKPYQITVIDLDEVAPVISLIGQDIIFHSTELEYLDEGAVWNDDVDGSGTVDAVGSVDTWNSRDDELAYDFTDSAGNPAETVIRKILVVDETLPSWHIVALRHWFIPFGNLSQNRELLLLMQLMEI